MFTGHNYRRLMRHQKIIQGKHNLKGDIDKMNKKWKNKNFIKSSTRKARGFQYNKGCTLFILYHYLK